VSRQRLVNGVVDHLIDHVMQAGAVIGVADIHAWPLADGVKSLQHFDRIGAVFFGSNTGSFSHYKQAFHNVFGPLD
jgi:hypothetical protein